MWAPVALLLVVGLASAAPGWNQEYSASSNNPGWRDNHEYIYRVYGRTLASLREVEQQYSGMVYKAEIRIQPRADDKIQGQIVKAQYSPIHTQLNEETYAHISEEHLNWKPLQLSSQPFQIVMKYGVITDLIVSKNIPNYEANIIKSIVSQFQLNTNGHKLVQSAMTSLPQGQNSGVFKTMEDTITGNTETLYTIKQVPDYMIQKTPLFNVEQFLEGEQDVYEVNKFKNYSNYQELPSYFYGLGQMENGEPGTNRMSDSFTRVSNTHAILTGNLNRYTIQHSVTYDEIVIRPTLQDQQKGSVVSVVNATLKEVTSQYQPIEQISSPINLGSLVYSYEHPFSSNNLVRERRRSDDMESDRLRLRDELKDRRDMLKRLRRSFYQEESSIISDESEHDWNNFYKQATPEMNEAPQSPLLPYTMGYKGMSIKQGGVDVPKTVQQMANAIAKSLQSPGEMTKRNVLNQFVTMASLIRLMNIQEIESATNQLYTQSDNQQKSDAWAVFRDGVAEAGTGPAYVVIRGWISAKKIKGNEASQIISTMLKSIRQPTGNYIRDFFEFIKNPVVQAEQPLNHTALLAYSQLLHRVYINKQYSIKQFPVHSFGTFHTQQGKQFIKETIIPYFTQQLNQAIVNAETSKIHVYIRVLGNIGTPEIFSAFEPYLEGQKQASQFQRFLMVVAMDKITQAYPEEARSVLFKIYQNSAETQEVRVAAVSQLMKSNPQPEMLQYMASFTNIDKHEHVNAAVKLLIQKAADEQDDEYCKLRQAAESAKPLLTDKIYGLQHGAEYIQNYFFDELNNKYHNYIKFVGSKDAYYPKGIMYRSYVKLGGISQEFADVQAMVSSVKHLLRVLENQTQEGKKERDEQGKNFEQQRQHPWSSQRIAELFNLKSEESEQLEGILNLALDEPFNYFLSFDNNTIKALPQFVKQYEESVRNGIKMDWTKFYNQHEIAYSVPTETGLPFLYTYDNPKVVKIEGRVTFKPSASLVEGNKLVKPQTVQVTSQMGLTVSSRIQGRISFTTPFDQKIYLAGYDKEWQTHVPLHGKYDIDLERHELKAEIELREPKNGAHLFQYKSEPYTSQVDITNFEPVSTQSSTKFIKQNNLRNYNKVLGKKEIGLAIRVNHVYERNFVDVPVLLQQVYQNGPKAGFKQLWNDNQIQYRKLQVIFVPEESSCKKIKIYLAKHSKYQVESKSQEAAPEYSDPQHVMQNEEQIENKVTSGMKNVNVNIIRGSIEFVGGNSMKHEFAGGIATSNVDYKARLGLYYQRQGPNPYIMSFQTQRFSPNTQTTDVQCALDKEPVVDINMELAFGPSYSSATKIQAEVHQRRSEERKRYLKEQPNYKKCQQEMNKGNKQLPACLNITMSSGFLDRIDAKVQYKNIKPEHEYFLQGNYLLPAYQFFPNVMVNQQKPSKPNQFEIKARFDPDLRSVNITLQTDKGEIQISDVPVNQIAMETLVPHAVYTPVTRMMKHTLQLPAYKPTCVIDNTMTSTFNNLTYPVDISKHWTVVLQKAPKVPVEPSQPQQSQSVQEHFKYQREHYAVLVRKSSDSGQNKDVKITISSPATSYKVVDITMRPSDKAMPKAIVSIDGQDVWISNKQAHDIGAGYIQIYSLSNGEVKVNVGDSFAVIYDGVRIRVSASQGKPKDSIIGLCGQFNNQETEDFLTSQNCLARNVKEFVKSFEIEGEEGQRLRQEFSGKSNKCFQKQEPLYVDVITDRDARRQESSDQISTGQCTHFQTRYIVEDGEICFTVRPLPVCSSRCHAAVTTSKNVSVHCIQSSNVAQLWKSQIDKGASPDFSHKQESKTISMPVPQSCVEN